MVVLWLESVGFFFSPCEGSDITKTSKTESIIVFIFFLRLNDTNVQSCAGVLNPILVEFIFCFLHQNFPYLRIRNSFSFVYYDHISYRE